MAKPKPSSKALMEFLAAPESHAAPTSAFSKHGIWAPGIGVMRNLQFGAKALVIGLMFLIPLAWTAYGLYSAKLDSIAFSSKESVGVQYEQDVFSLLQAAQDMRSESAGKTDPATALAKLSATNKQLGAALDTQAAFDNVEKAFADKAGTQQVQAVLALLSGVADNSNLTLDPDIDSYYLMDAALFRLPVILDNAARLRDMGLSSMKAGTVSAQQQQQFATQMGIAEFQIDGLRDGLKKAFAYNKGLSSHVAAEKALTDTAAFFTLARKTLVDAQDVSPAAQAAFLAAANLSITSQFELAGHLLEQLDIVVNTRVSGLQFDIYLNSAVLVVGLVLAGYFFYSFYLVNRGGLNLISEHLKQMAHGDLRTAPAKPWGKDEPAQVIMDLRVVYDSLHLLIRKVRHSARSLNAASDEIASASVDLSARTESAAAALEQQAASMEEMSSTVTATADHAQMATAFAGENAEVAEKGGKVFGQVVSTMRDIQVSSNKIGDIIGVIDAIAFQTNILALNAAVEAARAGESGRGFAVVATEVRSLAGRSAKAAQEIKSLISASVRQVDEGTTVIEEASRSMQEVVTNARQINQFLSEIATAAREQAAGVQEVGRSIQDLDRSTQQNAALVEETTAASGALSELASTLQDEIANFRVA